MIEALLFSVREEARQIVLGALLGDGIGWTDEHIAQKTGLNWRDICEPPAHI